MAKNYTINNIVKRSMVDTTGAFRNVYEISFTTISGVRDTVEIDVKDYSPDYVKTLLSDLTAKHEQIMAQ